MSATEVQVTVTRTCRYCGEPLDPQRHHNAKFCSPQHSRLFQNEKHSTRKDKTKPIVRRSRRQYEVTTTCLQCGVELTGMRKRFCSQEHANVYWDVTRKSGVAEGYHVLSEIDETARTATCSICGPACAIYSAGTKRKADGSRRWKCRSTTLREHNQHARWESEWRKRGVILTASEYLAMLAAQESKCAICRQPFDGRAPVDHDHETGRVRGLLCGSCNLGLGIFAESPERLRQAAEYLNRRS